MSFLDTDDFCREGIDNLWVNYVYYRK